MFTFIYLEFTSARGPCKEMPGRTDGKACSANMWRSQVLITDYFEYLWSTVHSREEIAFHKAGSHEGHLRGGVNIGTADFMIL